MWAIWIGVAVATGVAGVVVYDLLQRRHAVLHNFPLIGHLRYLLEAVGPELRQYIVTDNRQERPFDRDQRRWIYASSKGSDNNFGFGSDVDFDRASGLILVHHSEFPLDRPRPDDDRLPCAKVLGRARRRPQAFRPSSVVNVSGMSFGALSSVAVRAIDLGCREAGCLHNTGEGGLIPAHDMGADLIFQIGTGYFGCHDRDGRMDLGRLADLCAEHRVRAVEIKLSQGAKPGLGGVLPAVKVTPEIAAARGVVAGEACRSPSRHSAFADEDGLLDFVESIAERTGLPVGIKSAVGTDRFWVRLADLMATTGRGVDFITVDGGEGGTGDAPLAFSDHVSLPFRLGFSRVYRVFAERGLEEDVVFVGSGRLGLPETALLAMAMGCDLVAVAREAMLSIGCIQALRCHTGRCPAGITTHSPWLTRGLDPDLKGERLARYVRTLRHEMLELSHACGAVHPALIDRDRIAILDGNDSASVTSIFDYKPEWGRLGERQRAELERIMAGGA